MRLRSLVFLLCLAPLFGAGCQSKPITPPSALKFHPSGLASYQDFNQQSFEHALASHQPTMLFFYANWCSTCAVQEPRYEDILQRYPHPITAFRVNFDESKQLRQQYRVFVQSTAVFIGADGKERGKLVGEQDPTDIVRALDVIHLSASSTTPEAS